MSTLLLIHLNQDESACTWAAYQKGVLLDSGSMEIENLANLAEMFPNASAHMYVPAEKLTVLNALLPNHTQAAIESIPYQVEEQLCHPIEDYYLAYEKSKDKQIQVLACTKKQMSIWQALISTSQLNVKLLSADCYLLPSSEKGSVWFDNSRVIFSTKEFMGALSSSLMPFIQDKVRLDDYQMFTPADENIIQLLPGNSTQLDAPLITAFNGEQKQGINLLRKGNETENWPHIWNHILRAPALVSLIFICLWMISMSIENHQLESEIARLDMEMHTLYQEAYPDAKRIVNPASQMRANLKEMVDKPRQISFIESLSNVAPAIKENSITIKLIRYDQNIGRLNISISAQSFGPIENLRSTIKGKNIASEFTDLVQTPEGVTGAITLNHSSDNI